MNCYFCSNYDASGKDVAVLLTWPLNPFPGNLFPGWNSQRRFDSQKAWNFFELVESYDAQVRIKLGDLSGTYTFPSRSTPTKIVPPPPPVNSLWYPLASSSDLTLYRNGQQLHAQACPAVNWQSQRSLPLPTKPRANVFPGFSPGAGC